MNNAYVVLQPNTPPDSSKPLAVFFFGSGICVDQSTAQSRASSFKSGSSPTSPDPQLASVAAYGTGVVITV